MKNIVCKLVICTLTLIMVLAFAACSNTDTDEANGVVNMELSIFVQSLNPQNYAASVNDCSRRLL